MTEPAAAFCLMGFRRVPLRPDGSETRNSYVVDVEVGGRRPSGLHPDRMVTPICRKP